MAIVQPVKVSDLDNGQKTLTPLNSSPLISPMNELKIRVLNTFPTIFQSYQQGSINNELTFIKTRNQLEDDILHHAVRLQVKKRLRLVNFQATLRTALAALKIFHNTALADCNTKYQINH